MARAHEETLLGACLLRAAAAFAEGEHSKGRPRDMPATRVETMRGVWSSTLTASKVAALITMWAIALIDQERDELGVEEFARWSAESRATVYSRLSEFRELWPEHDTPNELARLVAAEARRRGEKPSPALRIAIAA